MCANNIYRVRETVTIKGSGCAAFDGLYGPKSNLFHFSLAYIKKKQYLCSVKGKTKNRMPSAEVANMIPTIQAYFKNQPIEYAYLFGSCARGEETKDSDVDILFAPKNDAITPTHQSRPGWSRDGRAAEQRLSKDSVRIKSDSRRT